MNTKKARKSNSTYGNIQNYFMTSDIRALVTIPPLVGFGSFFLILFLLEKLTSGTTPQAFFEIGLGIASLIECVAGVSMIIKKEMPGPLGNLITGKYAIISGWTIVLLFGLSGLLVIGFGLANLFQN